MAKCNYCGSPTEYNTCSEACRRANNKMMAKGNFANQAEMRKKLNGGKYFPKPTGKDSTDVFPSREEVQEWLQSNEMRTNLGNTEELVNAAALKFNLTHEQATRLVRNSTTDASISAKDAAIIRRAIDIAFDGEKEDKELIEELSKLIREGKVKAEADPVTKKAFSGNFVDNESGDEHLGFKKLEHKLAHKKGVHNAAAVAAAIGRKKYGAKGMAAKAAAGKK